MTLSSFNRLGREKSPYLLQHKDNPVHWYPWGEEAFATAKREGKPVFLSIGYSTCYWCHVMEKESFEHEDVATVLNEHFISIKVDREELPDVDQVYMDAVVIMTGYGGWPMSLFLAPDKRPFFGGTYFPREQFMQIMLQIAEKWRENPQMIARAATELTDLLKKQEGPLGEEAKLDEDLFRAAYRDLERSFDPRFGGFGSAPKFPRTESLALLLRIHRRTGSGQALEMVTTTLDQMARGGLYDQLGGGFHRYSTDARWLVPHFEKMLYDNALLASVYLEAYRVTKNEMFREVAEGTLNYVRSEMTDEAGAFHSAEDAGEVGEEGAFYVWDYSELKKVLSDTELKRITEVYGVTEHGNFEDEKNILFLPASQPWSAKHEPLVHELSEKLRHARKKRIPPHRDDKILTDWNGLMIGALADGYRVLGNERYLTAAENAAKFIQEKLYRPNKMVLRRYRDGDAAFPGVLSDYSYLIAGLLSLYQASFNERWLTWAVTLQEMQDRLFWDNESAGYFFTSTEGEQLIVRKKELHDGAVPSPNAVSTLNLLQLYALTGRKEFETRANELFISMSGPMSKYPSAYASALIALDYKLDRSKEVGVIGDRESQVWKDFRKYLAQTFLPNIVLAFGESGKALTDESAPVPLRGKERLDGKTTFYVCEHHVCKLPTNDLGKVKELIESLVRYEL